MIHSKVTRIVVCDIELQDQDWDSEVQDQDSSLKSRKL